MSKKTKGWENRLIAYLHQIHAKPFEPSSLDCGMMSNGAIEAMTGINHAKKLIGRYKTVERGLAMVRKMGFADHIEWAAGLFEEYSSPLMAQRGDLAAVRDGDAVALGIVQGERVYVMTLQGLGLVSLTQAFRAFKI